MTCRILLTVLFAIPLLASCAANPANAQHDDGAVHDGPAMNFHRISPRLATGGHFTENGIDAIAEQGVSLVIDLRDRPPEDQEERLAEAGIRWLNVPVAWDSPRREDFAAFSRLMSENEDEDILVQCQANYRASAMTFLYRVTVLGVPETEAREDLNAIWTPQEGPWLTLIDEILMAN